MTAIRTTREQHARMILAAILEHGGGSIRSVDIAHRLGISRGYVTDTMTALRAAGLVVSTAVLRHGTIAWALTPDGLVAVGGDPDEPALALGLRNRPKPETGPRPPSAARLRQEADDAANAEFLRIRQRRCYAVESPPLDIRAPSSVFDLARHL